MVFKKARITRIIVEMDDLLGDFKAKIGVILALVPLLFQFYMLFCYIIGSFCCGW